MPRLRHHADDRLCLCTLHALTCPTTEDLMQDEDCFIRLYTWEKTARRRGGEGLVYEGLWAGAPTPRPRAGAPTRARGGRSPEPAHRGGALPRDESRFPRARGAERWAWRAWRAQHCSTVLYGCVCCSHFARVLQATQKDTHTVCALASRARERLGVAPGQGGSVLHSCAGLTRRACSISLVGERPRVPRVCFEYAGCRQAAEPGNLNSPGFRFSL